MSIPYINPILSCNIIILIHAVLDFLYDKSLYLLTIIRISDSLKYTICMYLITFSSYHFPVDKKGRRLSQIEVMKMSLKKVDAGSDSEEEKVITHCYVE